MGFKNKNKQTNIFWSLGAHSITRDPGRPGAAGAQPLGLLPLHLRARAPTILTKSPLEAEFKQEKIKL